MTDWTPEQLGRKARAEAGSCVVINMRKHKDTALMDWAKETGRFVRIDRQSAWGNRFEMDQGDIRKDGTRSEVIQKFETFDLPGLRPRLHTLRGKVLGCWCHPEACHGHLIAEIVNCEAMYEGSAPPLADTDVEFVTPIAKAASAQEQIVGQDRKARRARVRIT